MAQATHVVLGAQIGSAFRAAVNSAFEAVVTMFSGPSAPSDTAPGTGIGQNQPRPNMFWGDTTAALWKKRNNANTEWISMGALDGPMGNGLCANLMVAVLPADLTQVIVGADILSVEGTVLPFLTGFGLLVLDTNNAAGINSIDAGSWATNTWYALFVVCNAEGTSKGLLASTSATAPTLPTGYTRRRRVAWIRTSGTATNLHVFKQMGPRAKWWRSEDTADLRVLDTASPATSFTDVAATTAAPPTAVRALIRGALDSDGSLTATQLLRVQPKTAGLGTGEFLTSISTPSDASMGTAEIDLDGSQVFQYLVSDATNISRALIDVVGWIDPVC